MDIIGKKNIYFFISLLIIIPGIISLILFGLRLSIDFTGGSRIEIQNSKFKVQNSKTGVEQIFKNQGIVVSSVQQSGQDVFIIKTKPIDQNQYQKVSDALKKKYNNVKELSFETVGPTIGSETTANALKAVIIAAFLIVLYIAWSFRKVPKPVSSLRFGICTVIALIHDVLVVLGIFSILGHFFKIEIDSLFMTAILTVIGFSVHDTIVVFDRIRENLKKSGSLPFASVVNASILQTLGRSINTSLTVILVLLTLLLFGGETLKWFMVALLVGVVSGTYSSIFNAAPLLVVWEEWERSRNKK